MEALPAQLPRRIVGGSIDCESRELFLDETKRKLTNGDTLCNAYQAGI